MKEIMMLHEAGAFAENKDVARDLRIHQIEPILRERKQVVLDFQGIEGVTQSFIHALISETLRTFGFDTLDLISFKNCNETVKKIITIVIEYMQESQ